jgi:uncharacterized membrane protein
MPWQLITALAIIGLEALYLAAQALGVGTVAAAYAGEDGAAAPLAVSGVTAVLAVLCVVVGACIAARYDKARRIAITINLVLVAFALLTVVILGLLGQFDVLTLLNGAFALFMIAMLSSEPAKAYTYRNAE